MTLWIGNGAVLKNASQWQLKEFGKLNNSVHELFIFKRQLKLQSALCNCSCLLDSVDPRSGCPFCAA